MTQHYLTWIADLPLPTESQVKAFCDHVCDAHSWYKHLDLLRGGDFVFFLAPDAGSGCPDDRPRVHHTWKTTSAYREHFGCLDYIVRVAPEEGPKRDARGIADGCQFVGLPPTETGPPLRLPLAVYEHASTILYPYVATYPEIDEWMDFLAGSMGQLRQGAEHPERKYLLRWYESYLQRLQIEEGVDGEEYEQARKRQSNSGDR